MNADEVKDAVKTFILREFLPGEDASALKDDTPLVTQGIMDSLASLKLVNFLEESYGIEIEAHEVDAQHLDTLTAITNLVLEKSS